MGCWDGVLDGLIDQALAHNQNLKVAIATVDQYQAQLMVARSQLFPQVSGGLLSSRQKISSSVTALPPGTPQVYNLFGALFNASYLLDLWGEVRSGVDSAYHQWLSAEEARRTVVLGLVSAVASAYFQLRQYDGLIAVSRETLKSRRESLYLAKIRFDLGLTSQMEVEQAITEVQDAESQLETFEVAAATAGKFDLFFDRLSVENGGEGIDFGPGVYAGVHSRYASFGSSFPEARISALPRKS